MSGINITSGKQYLSTDPFYQYHYKLYIKCIVTMPCFKNLRDFN